jgi:alkanesulfonate monooxygenase SsuD/methylene tetrahydromethanopterin reductase-like flavin-dependent oxidoreductase (luciferase family)
MGTEFRAVGVDRRRRGRITDETLDFLDRCFAGDVVEANGQPFLFLPRPPRPALFIGGAAPHAFRRAIAHRGGWMPIGVDPDGLRPLAARLREEAAGAGLPPPEIAVMTTLPTGDPSAARDLLARFDAAGATRIVHGARYADGAEFRVMLDALVRVVGA